VQPAWSLPTRTWQRGGRSGAGLVDESADVFHSPCGRARPELDWPGKSTPPDCFPPATLADRDGTNGREDTVEPDKAGRWQGIVRHAATPFAVERVHAVAVELGLGRFRKRQSEIGFGFSVRAEISQMRRADVLARCHR